jgi:GAF domain-containing protein
VAAQLGKPIIIHDALRDERFQTRQNKVSIGSILSLPLIYSRDELVGILNLSHPKAEVFEDEDLQIISVLLSPAALALRNAKLMREVEEINKMLKAELCMTDKASWSLVRVSSRYSTGCPWECSPPIPRAS